MTGFDNPYLNVNDTVALLALVRSVEPKVMIEIGCQIGRTARVLLGAVPSLEKYIGIDVPPDHKPTLHQQITEIPKVAGHYAADDKRFFLLVREGGSQTLVPEDLEPCDAVFIDGDHSEVAVLMDSGLARGLVRPGGIIIWHDYNNPAVEVTHAIDILRADKWPIQIVPNTWLAFMRVAPP